MLSQQAGRCLLYEAEILPRRPRGLPIPPTLHRNFVQGPNGWPMPLYVGYYFKVKTLCNASCMGRICVQEAKKQANASHLGHTFCPGGHEAGQSLLFGERVISRRSRGWPTPPVSGITSVQETQQAGQCLLYRSEILSRRPSGWPIPPTLGRNFVQRPNDWPVPPVWGRHSVQVNGLAKCLLYGAVCIFVLSYWDIDPCL